MPTKEKKGTMHFCMQKWQKTYISPNTFLLAEVRKDIMSKIKAKMVCIVTPYFKYTLTILNLYKRKIINDYRI